jgi:alpha-tubulin suppressor-like RCC1 family protein
MRRSRLWSMTSIALCVVACGARQTDVDCSPTPSCSLNDKRFAPASKPDAGEPECEAHTSQCRAEEIAAGGALGCMRTASGELLCWGVPQVGSVVPGGSSGAAPATAHGHAGAGAADGGAHDAGAPTANISPPPHDAVQITAGGAHACARTRLGDVLCWGSGEHGQVDGHVWPGVSFQPVHVALDPASDIDAGDAHTCAVVARGVTCWGDARFGQSGREIGEHALRPGLVPGTEDAVEVATGVRHSCARLADGHVLCWGQLIDDDGQPRAHAEAVEVAGLDDALEIDAGAGHTCALRPRGVIACWGDNTSGQLGDGTQRASATPVTVAHLPQVLHVSAGGVATDDGMVGHTCAVDTGFFVQCWGSNDAGQLGVGNASNSTRPQIVQGRSDESDEPYLQDVVAVSAGSLHSCALSHRGRVWCWGDNSRGQLGVDLDDTPPFGRAVRAHTFFRLE